MNVYEFVKNYYKKNHWSKDKCKICALIYDSMPCLKDCCVMDCCVIESFFEVFEKVRKLKKIGDINE